MTTVITPAMLVELADTRLLNSLFENAWRKHYAGPNPVGLLIHEENRKVEQIYRGRIARIAATLVAICAATVIILLVPIIVLLPTLRTWIELWWFFAIILLVFATAVGGKFTPDALAYFRPTKARSLSLYGVDAVEIFCRDLNSLVNNLETEIKDQTQGRTPDSIKSILTVSMGVGRLCECAGDAVTKAAFVVVQFQHAHLRSERESSIVSFEGKLRKTVEVCYDNMKIFGLVPEGGVGPYYEAAEKLLKAKIGETLSPEAGGVS